MRRPIESRSSRGGCVVDVRGWHGLAKTLIYSRDNSGIFGQIFKALLPWGSAKETLSNGIRHVGIGLLDDIKILAAKMSTCRVARSISPKRSL